MNNLSNNLKKLRLEKDYTQEQIAEKLGVSSKAVSRWECGTSFPDIMMLPEIARLYCVTVDDLYTEKTVAYNNYAQRLFAIYESTRKPEDFIRVDEEYKRLMKTDKYSANDLRLYGIAHQYMMNYSFKKADELYDAALKISENEENYWKVRRQKLLLFAQSGKSNENTELQLKTVKEEPENTRERELLITSYYLAKQYDKAYECYVNAVKQFPNDKLLWFCGGDICQKLKKFDEAFECWNKALEIDDSFYDAKYSIAFCYQELGEYEKAYKIWKDISRELEKEGYIVETELPLKMADKCKEKINTIK